MSRELDDHRLYLSDAVRVAAFEAALAAVVRPGDIVLDLGSGTGILGLLAIRAGAAEVFAVESGGMAQAAREVVHANALDGRVHVVNGFSSDIDLPRRATLLVTDQIGHFGFDAGVVPFVADARRRLLQPDARLVPNRIDLWLAPCEAADVDEAVAFWERRPGGFDMSPLRAVAANSGHPRTVDAAQLCGTACRAGSIDLAGDLSSPVVLSAESRVTRRGRLHGVAGWFSAALGGDVVLTNSPLAAQRVARRGVVFPIDPVDVEPGDRIRTGMRILPGDLIVRWELDVARGGQSVARSVRSTLRGMLIPAERLRRTHPDFVPSLNPRGRARLSVLELCDGRRSLAEIEHDLFARHPSLFADHAAAAAFVAEVITAYSE